MKLRVSGSTSNVIEGGHARHWTHACADEQKLNVGCLHIILVQLGFWHGELSLPPMGTPLFEMDGK
jgi:hypothetical protein